MTKVCLGHATPRYSIISYGESRPDLHKIPPEHNTRVSRESTVRFCPLPSLLAVHHLAAPSVAWQ